MPTRTVTAHLEVTVTDPADLVFSVAVAGDLPAGAETFTATVAGVALTPEIVRAPHGTRLHVLRQAPAGDLLLDYRARVDGPAPQVADPAGDAADRIASLRPSRYCESDTLAAVAAAQFAGLGGKELLDAVSSWVGQQLAYVSGSSRPTDGAVQTYLAREGVCRDFAHLVIALLRSLGVPARLVSVYAPGLDPMDFHAVAEAGLADGWHVVDATTLAPRSAMLRIATGRDASDTAFMTVLSGRADLTGMQVGATIDPQLPDDDLTDLVLLG